VGWGLGGGVAEGEDRDGGDRGWGLVGDRGDEGRGGGSKRPTGGPSGVGEGFSFRSERMREERGGGWG
jgi:hypothetical protein